MPPLQGGATQVATGDQNCWFVLHTDLPFGKQNLTHGYTWLAGKFTICSFFLGIFPIKRHVFSGEISSMFDWQRGMVKWTGIWWRGFIIFSISWGFDVTTNHFYQRINCIWGFNHEKYGGTFDKWLLVDGWLVKHLGLFICLVKTGKINITELGMDERLGKTPE